MQEQTDERPPPDYRDHLEIGTGSDDDDSFRRKPKDDGHKLDERVLH